MQTLEERQEHRTRMLAMTDQLVAEYADRLPAVAVVGMVARCQEQLRVAGLRAGLPEATEAMARRRLADIVSPH